MNISRPKRALALAGALVLGSGCSMDVANPAVIDAATFDPTADAVTLSMSAQTNFYFGFGAVVHFGAYFSGEYWVGGARQETNDIGRRVVSSANLDVPAIWTPLQLGLSSNELAIPVLAAGPAAASDINLARVYMNAGFSLLLLAEHFCEGIILVGPPLTPAQVFDTAAARFIRAAEVASAASGAEAVKILNASRVGLGRAYLGRKDYQRAAAAVASVPAAFRYDAVHSEDATNRARVGNRVFANTASRIVVVPDAYRAMNDPRVPWTDVGGLAADGVLRLHRQDKYPGYGAPIRVASGLEASYIAAEAALLTGTPAPALALIAARRAANGQGEFGGGDESAVLAELMEQRAREFWLEGKHTGDWVRHPTVTPHVGASGTPFYKPVQGEFGAATCWPVPDFERLANPNYPR